MHGVPPRLILIVAAFSSLWGSARAQDLPGGFVYLRDVDRGIIQDIRYAGSDNFVGRPLPGYDAAECILRREAASALKLVQSDLRALGFGLKVYDCYRPAGAVRAMVKWVTSGTPGETSKQFFPRLEKRKLLAGYLAAVSRHSTGTAVDATLVELAREALTRNAVAPPAPCIAPAAERGHDGSVDMGPGYDCFDRLSHTRSPGIGAQQRRARDVLVAAMRRRGFANYHREWWHFSFTRAAPVAYYGFPIR
jgi:D-alanyl-D-alanine dipeptidase